MADHFSENPELLESYVLGRLDAPTMASCAAHERECRTCREAVAREQMLAAGIRRAGRNALKARIASGATPTSRDLWPAILSAAAVVVVMIGVGISERWFVSDKPVAEQPIAQAPAENNQTERRKEVPDKLSARPEIEPAPSPRLPEKRGNETLREAPTVSDAATNFPAEKKDKQAFAAGAVLQSERAASPVIVDSVVVRVLPIAGLMKARANKMEMIRSIDARRDSGMIIVSIHTDDTTHATARLIGTDSVLVIVGPEQRRIPIGR